MKKTKNKKPTNLNNKVRLTLLLAAATIGYKNEGQLTEDFISDALIAMECGDFEFAAQLDLINILLEYQQLFLDKYINEEN